ncbi:MAG: hypothetical protein A2857_04060 [Candidatus Levybacteria bacterium RIFCSPHIGHO2_01_FULL_36_15]|nr:MAG: hypothetical protein A2857_04060 [Candidatus Levybacteria bacterium RIFCSPHIGHO2_01_FULL_36_15]OGH37442.1 MAG: hypothetical protein A2905_04895 [Candidatus Levybacteria bacterium RIFCSPLOWO2_01_FULL_36_10]
MIHVLFVDDDAAITKIVSSVLSNKEFIVDTASSGIRGLDLAKKVKPDIILLDQILPDILGNDILARLKQDADTKLIPVVIFSAYFNIQAKEEALKRGALDYVAKYELEPTMLGEKIKKYLKIDEST